MSQVKKPQILLIIGPTAVGKSSIIEKALIDFPDLCDIITYTTRNPRAGEKQGDPYHFVDEQRFRELIPQGFFVEWANVHGRLYGTPRDQVLAAAARGQIVVIDVDVQGAKSICREYPQTETIFLLPPSIDALSHRFKKRGVVDPEDLKRRLESAQIEMAQASDFKHQIINADLEQAYLQVRKVIEKIPKPQ